MFEIPTQSLYQFQHHITQALSYRAHMVDVEFRMLASQHIKVEKAHFDLKQKNENIDKEQETQQSVVNKIYRRIKEGTPNVPVEYQLHKVETIITNLQAQVEELQLKIRPETPLEESERRKKVDEASLKLQKMSTIKPYYQTLDGISFGIYQQLLDAMEMQQINYEFQEIDQQRRHIEASIVTLSMDVGT